MSIRGLKIFFSYTIGETMPTENHSTRRNFIKNTGLGAAAIACASRVSDAAGANEKRPNIFFAIADDWGWPHAGIYGDTVVKTTTFDSIAQNGILFNNAYVSAPSCTPSRGAALTGQFHWRLGHGANLHSSLPEEHKTYPNILEDNGYFTGSYRKAWGPGKQRERNAAGQPYDSFKDFLDKRPKDKPFCFWSGSSDPHRAYTWKSGVDSGMDLDDVFVPPYLPDCEEVRTDICDYYWEVQRFDREIGEQLKLLEDIGELDNTLILMTGDNGWPFPRAKSNLYDYGVHMPLAVQWGNKIRKGRVVDDFVSFTDFAPTFIEAAGLKPLAAMTGRSLMNVFEADTSGIIDPSRDHTLTGKERHTPAQADHMGGTPMRSIHTRHYLYIHNFKPERWPAGGPVSMRGPAYSDIDGSPTKDYILAHKDDPELKKYFDLCIAKRPADELYDLRKDPYQLHNVADDPKYSLPLKSLKDRLMMELRETGDPRVLGNGDVFDNYPYYGNMGK